MRLSTFLKGTEMLMWRSISANSLFVILRSPRASFFSFHRLNVDSRNLSRLMPSSLRGCPILGRFAAIATEELLNRHRIPLDYRLESSDCQQIIPRTERTINHENIYVKIYAALYSNRSMEKDYFL